VEWVLWLTPLVIRIESCLHRPLIDVILQTWMMHRAFMLGTEATGGETYPSIPVRGELTLAIEPKRILMCHKWNLYALFTKT